MRVLLIWIIGVSALDAAYCVHDGAGFVRDEVNPLVSYVVTEWRLPVFVGMKLFGTSLSCLLMREMVDCGYRHRHVVVTAMCTVQLAVLLSYVPRWF